jgi:hypothetical protein
MYSCKKNAMMLSNSGKSVSNSFDNKDSLVLTPEGLIPASHLHLIENGYHLEIRNGHVLKVEDKTKKIAADFGERKLPSNKSTPQQNQTGKQLSSSPNSHTGAFSSISNWITYAEWQNTTGSPINYFSTNWTVPIGMVPNHNQVIFIFNALTPAELSPNIVQPVLQYGVSGNGGGAYWVIDNWYGWQDASGNNQFAYMTPVQVSPGTNIQGVITYTGQQTGTGSYNYTSTVYYSGTSLAMSVIDGTTYNKTIPYVPLNLWAFETLEAYDSPSETHVELDHASDYPAQPYVAMTNVNITTVASSSPSVQWHAATGTNALYNEYTNIANPNTTGSGEVDLHFNASPSIKYTTPNVYTENTAISSLNPTTTGGATPTSYSVSPSLPAGLTLNTTTGAITGTPTVGTSATLYTVTATNSYGSGTFPVNIAVAFPYDFQVKTESYSSSTFTLAVNGVTVANGVQTASYNVVKDNDYNIVPNPSSTVVLTINSGHMPTSATLATYLGGGYGTISGNTITWTGIEVVTKQPSLLITLN